MEHTRKSGRLGAILGRILDFVLSDSLILIRRHLLDGSSLLGSALGRSLLHRSLLGGGLLDGRLGLSLLLLIILILGSLLLDSLLGGGALLLGRSSLLTVDGSSLGATLLAASGLGSRSGGLIAVGGRRGGSDGTSVLGDVVRLEETLVALGAVKMSENGRGRWRMVTYAAALVTISSSSATLAKSIFPPSVCLMQATRNLTCSEASTLVADMMKVVLVL